MDRRRYPQQQYVPPGMVDFGQMDFGHDVVAQQMPGILQNYQQRWDMQDAAIAKLLEEQAGTQMLEGDAQAVGNLLKGSFDGIDTLVKKKYQGDRGAAAMDIVKRLSAARAPLAQARVEKEKYDKAFAEYQNAAQRGQAPKTFIPGEGFKTLDFDTYHELQGQQAFGEKGYTPRSYNPLRGASDLSGYLDKGISKKLSSRVWQDILKENEKTPGYLEQITRKGYTGEQLEKYFDPKNFDQDAFVKELIGEVPHLAQEFENASPEELFDYAKGIIKSQVSEQLMKGYQTDRTWKEKEEETGFNGNFPLPISKFVDAGNFEAVIPLSTLRTDPKYTALVTKAEEEVKNNNPEFKEMSLSTFVKNTLPSIVGKKIDDIDFQNIVNATDFSNVSDEITLVKRKRAMNDLADELADKYGIRSKDILKATARYKTINRNFNKAVDANLKGLKFTNQKVIASIGSGYDNALSQWFTNQDASSTFITTSNEEVSEDSFKDLKNVEVIKANLHSPTKFTLIPKEQKNKSTVLLKKDREDADALVKSISFEANDIDVYKQHKTHSLLSDLYNKKDVQVGSVLVSKISKADLKKQGISPDNMIGDGDTYYYVNNGESALSPVYSNPADAMEAALTLQNIPSPTDEFLEYLQRSNASKDDVQKTAIYLQNFKKKLQSINNK